MKSLARRDFGGLKILTGSGAGTAGLVIAARMFGTLLTLVYTVLLARVMLPVDVGLTFAAISAALLGSIVATMGVEMGSIRYLVSYLNDDRPGPAAGFETFSRRIVILTIPLTLVMVLLFGASQLRGGDTQAYWALALAVGCAPIIGVTRAQARNATALGHVLRGALPRLLVRPVFFTVTLGLAYLSGFTLTPVVILALYLVSEALTALMQYALLRAKMGFRDAAAPAVDDWRSWIGTGLKLSPLMVMKDFLRDLIIIAAAFTMIAEDVARLGIALSIIGLIQFSVSAVEMAYSAKIAQTVVTGNRAQSHMFLRRVGAFRLAVLLLGAGGIYLLLDLVLPLFGKEYDLSDGTFLALLILPASTVIFGPASLVLNVAGRSNALMAVSLAGIALVAAGAAFGGYAGGLFGACLGAAAGVGLQQMALFIHCRTRLAIDTSVLALVSRPGGTAP